MALNQWKFREDPIALIWYPPAGKQNYIEEMIKSIKS
jgi:hypothetical protein